MKTLMLSLALLLGMGALPGPQAGQRDDRFSEFSFAPYGGVQITWPVAENARVIQDHAVPIYLGLPQRRYIIMGRILASPSPGLITVKHVPPGEIFNEMGRQRSCASLARQQGGDAVVVTDHPAILKAFNLTKEEIEKTAPLLANKDRLVLVIRFDSGVAGAK